MTWMTVDLQVALEVASHEALIREAYKDSVDIWTWCVGMTDATGHRVARYKDNPASLQHCMNIYAWALANYAEGVKRAFRGTPLTKAQFAAALSFHWNTGRIGNAQWVRDFKAGNVAAARRNIMNFRSPPEIVPRRRKERDLFFDGKWNNNGTMLEFTRVHRPSYFPDWSSGRRIHVRHELEQAFKGHTAVELDHAPVPDNQPSRPTPSPEGIIVEPAMNNPLGTIIFILVVLGAGAFVAMQLGLFSWPF